MNGQMSVSATLNKAADLIEERGWGQGPHGWGVGARLCLEGGIIAALGETLSVVRLAEFYTCPAYTSVMRYLERDETPILRDGHGQALVAEPLWDWNDDDGRTAAEVIATLRAAALIEAAKETAADPLVAHLAHHAVDIIAAELDTTAAPL